MNMFKRQTYLCEPVENMVLGPVLQLTSIFVSRLVLFLYTPLEITAISEVHDDAKLTLFSFVDLPEPHDVGVVQHLENLGFSQSLFSLLFGHLLYIDLLNDSQSFIALTLHEIRRPKGPNPQSLHLLISFVTFLVLHDQITLLL